MPKTHADEMDDVDFGMSGEEADIDFSEVAETAGNQILPPDTYNAVVVDVEKRRGEKGIYYNWKFSITDDPYQDVKVYRVTSLAEKAADGTFKTLQVILGAPIPRGKFSLSAYYDRFLGRPVRLKIKTREYMGTPQNEVDRILPPSSGAGASSVSDNKLF